eukprot:GEMP01059068.1.p1 GENE.GEMP01059068.1~~GEMP01059068.1.p1  ORF type:complete len:305 (+),score=75.71 GEMP01059068.1:61-975(+)
MAEEEPEGNPLTAEILATSLSKTAKQTNGSGYAMTFLNCSAKELTSLEVLEDRCEDIRHAVLSANKLTSLGPILKKTHLLSILGDHNDIENIEPQVALDYLQHLDLSDNPLSRAPTLEKWPRLRILKLSHTKLASVENLHGAAALEMLELRENQLTSLKGLGNLPALERLYAASNQIDDLSFDTLPLLQVLHLRKNAIESLETMPTLPALQNLNLRENNLFIEHLDQLKLGGKTPSLYKLNVLGNEQIGELVPDVNAHVFLHCPITIVNKAEITEEDRARAEEIRAEQEAKANEPPPEEEEKEA